MRRLRAFVLAEILMTMMLQAGFILLLCASFYMLTSFYSKTQQVLTARSHAERAISFFDNKVRNAGLGLWRCTKSSTIRGRLNKIPNLKTSRQFASGPNNGYRLPVALTWFEDNVDKIPDLPDSEELNDKEILNGDVVVLLYAEPDRSDNCLLFKVNEENQFKLDTRTSTASNPETGENVTVTIKDPTKGGATITMIDNNISGSFKFEGEQTERNIGRWALAESIGMPFYVQNTNNVSNIGINFYGIAGIPQYNIDEELLPDTMKIPDAGDLMYLKCIQIFVHTHPTEQDRQLAFRTLNVNGDTWIPENGYNQEKNILDIYMELDTSTNIFTLYVLAQGGYDASANNPRPSAWPKEANPKGDNDDKAKTEWLKHDYSHYTVYVSRASWKLNNIPPDFNWN